MLSHEARDGGQDSEKAGSFPEDEWNSPSHSLESFQLGFVFPPLPTSQHVPHQCSFFLKNLHSSQWFYPQRQVPMLMILFFEWKQQNGKFANQQIADLRCI